MSFAIEVVDTGSLDFNSVGGTLGVRPALNLNLSSVLFSSVAEGGKSTSVDGTMSAISSTTPSAWKLTLDDSANRSGFTVTETAMAAKQGDTKTITYSNANIGGREYVSAMITNSAGTEILYYGKLVHAQNIASGTADITIPSSLDAGTYSLKIFSEQCNGDKKTDLSSAFKNIALTVTAAPKAVGTTSATVHHATMIISGRSRKNLLRLRTARLPISVQRAVIYQHVSRSRLISIMFLRVQIR